MALHKVMIAVFIDGEGRDEETVASAVSEGCGSFGPVSEAFAGFPDGRYLGSEVTEVKVPTEEEAHVYSE